MMVKSVTLCVEVSILLLHYYSAAIPVEKFYPFGESTADQSLPRGDDITNMTNLSTTFPFFDTNYTTLEVGGQESSKLTVVINNADIIML